VLVVVGVVRGVPVPVVDVVQVVVVLNGAVPAAVAVHMVVLGGFVVSVRRHVGHRCPVCGRS
jgi:hypothetical protein